MDFVLIWGLGLSIALGTAVVYFVQKSRIKAFFGEMLVHMITKIHLNGQKYHILKNITLPTTEGITQIDHIIVSEYGVFVIETMNMKGSIIGDASQPVWTQKIFNYSRKFKNPIYRTDAIANMLQTRLELSGQQIFPMVVFMGTSTFRTPMPENVIDAPGLIKYIKSKKQPVILNSDVSMILSKIDAERLPPSKETIEAHQNRVSERVDEQSNGLSFTAVQRHKKPADPDIDMESTFKDSWQHQSWRDDVSFQPAFTDGR